MMKRALLIGMVLGVLAASGCCGLYRGCGITVCEPVGCCDAGCGPVCDDGCGMDCGSGCGGCGDACCEPCYDPCGGYGYRRGPLSWVLGVFRCCFHCGWWGGCGACGGGCGEFYWSDFHSVPPDCCDPCDRCGNWTGGGGGCDTCWEGYGQTPGYEGGYIARNQAQGAHRTARAMGGPKASQGYVSGDSSSRYAPRIVSVTDRAGPAESGSSSAGQAGRPHLAPVRK